MLSQIVEIEDVDYVPIYVTAEIEVQSFYVRADVVSRVQQAAATLLAFERVDFNQLIYSEQVLRREPERSRSGLRQHHRVPARGSARTLVAPLGKIELGANEVPVIPADKDYAAGMQVIVKNSGRSVTMRLTKITATAHPAGNRIDLAWDYPPGEGLPGVRVVRKEGSHPEKPDDGVEVAMVQDRHRREVSLTIASEGRDGLLLHPVPLPRDAAGVRARHL